MRKVAILTDSASDIPEDLREKTGVDIMSFTITLDDVSYEERRDFTNEEYYNMLRNSQGMPSTAHITAMQFVEKYAEYARAGYTDVIHVTINSGGSNTYSAAQLAIKQLCEEYPWCKIKIHLIDGHNYSMTYGWFVCEAARKIKNGAEIKDVTNWLEEQYAEMEVVVSAYSLKFMKKSGRISAAAAFAGELLGLRPIITIIDGKTAVVNKVRGDSAVVPALLNHLKANKSENDEVFVACTNQEYGAEAARLLKKELGIQPTIIFSLGAAIASNTGPDAVAYIFHGKKRR